MVTSCPPLPASLVELQLQHVCVEVLDEEGFLLHHVLQEERGGEGRRSRDLYGVLLGRREGHLLHQMLWARGRGGKEVRAMGIEGKGTD